MNIWILMTLTAGAIHLTGLLMLVHCARWAPEGYEDADGFHFGPLPVPQSHHT
jgi:hypothetical protein